MESKNIIKIFHTKVNNNNPSCFIRQVCKTNDFGAKACLWETFGWDTTTQSHYCLHKLIAMLNRAPLSE